MTAVLAILSPLGVSAREREVQRALRATVPGGTLEVRSLGSGSLGVVCAPWEVGRGRSPRMAMASDHGAIVVTDSTLYYRRDLRRALDGRIAVSPSANDAELILAAYRVDGPDFVQRLEGDFAFILWDAHSGRVEAARDPGATRSLYYARYRDGFTIGSALRGLLSVGASDAIDYDYLGEIAAGLATGESRTCRRSIRSVPAGHVCSWRDGSTPTTAPFWNAPRFEQDGRLSFEDGAIALRELLTSAVHERLDEAGGTSIWLSGGYDSPAVFGAAMLATNGDTSRVRAVSISYPRGDAGCEDDFISSIADRWSSSPHWIESAAIQLLADMEQGAATRDEPFAHVFEHWNRALARGSRAVHTHVALHGNGGDQLFQVSLVYLADLLRRGRLRTLARECRARGVRDARTFFRWAVQPNLPLPITDAIGAARGRRLQHYLERTVPPWISADLVRRARLEGSARRVIRPQGGETLSSAESRHYFTHPYFPRVYACVSELAREEQVELRSPLLDSRVIDFAARRPREERACGVETKRALRAAMCGVIPDQVLAPRRTRTGTTGQLFARALRSAGPALIADVTERSRLGDAGIVVPRRLADGYRQWLATGDGNLGVALFLTVQAEYWLRAHTGASHPMPLVSPRATLASVAG